MTAQLITSLLWTVLILIPGVRDLLANLGSELLKPVADLIDFDSIPGILLLLGGALQFAFALALLYLATYLVVRYLLINEIRKATGSPERNPDYIGTFARLIVIVLGIAFIAVSILFNLDNLTEMAESLINRGILALLIIVMVIIGVSRGFGRREVPEDISDSPELPDLDELESLTIQPSGRTIEHSYEWLFDKDPFISTGRKMSLELDVSILGEDYDRSVEMSLEKKGRANHPALATDEVSSSAVLTVASRLRQYSAELGIRAFEELHLVFSFFSCMDQMEPDEEHADCVKYPVQTIADGGGTKVDVAVACSAVFDRLGYDTYLSIDEEHAVVGVAVPPQEGIEYELLRLWDGKDLFICEIAEEAKPEGEDKEGPSGFSFWFESDPETGICSYNFIYLVDAPREEPAEAGEEPTEHASDELSSSDFGDEPGWHDEPEEQA